LEMIRYKTATAINTPPIMNFTRLVDGWDGAGFSMKKTSKMRWLDFYAVENDTHSFSHTQINSH